VKPKVRQLVILSGVLISLIMAISATCLWQQTKIKKLNFDILLYKQDICIDNDIYNFKHEQYLPGSVTYYGLEGRQIIVNDECIQDNTAVWEGQCHTNTNGEIWVNRTIILCENGCENRACLIPSLPLDHVTLPTTTSTPVPLELYSYEPLESWQRTDISIERSFSMLSPAFCYHRPIQGIDSSVGEIICPDFSLSYDYGSYSNSLKGYEDSHNVSYPTIGKRQAKLIEPQVYPDIIGVYFDQVKKGEAIENEIVPKLQLSGMIYTPSQHEVAKQMLLSIQFKD